jgi:hypothetical protein
MYRNDKKMKCPICNWEFPQNYSAFRCLGCGLEVDLRNGKLLPIRNPRRLRKRHFKDKSLNNFPNTVYVGRPSKWGNPFTVKQYGREECLKKYDQWVKLQMVIDPDFLKPLKGKNLVCFCKLSEKCHADILLKYANSEVKKWY